MPEKNLPLELDSEGNVITKPITAWSTVTLAGIAGLLILQYAETREALERGEYRQIQLALMPQQCLWLAEGLTKLGKSLLENQSDGETKH